MRLTRTQAIVFAALLALGGWGGGHVLAAVQHAVSGPTCTLRWIGSDAYIVMQGSGAYDACLAAMGLSSNLTEVDGAPSFPTVCRYALTANTTVTVRDSGADVIGSQWCSGQSGT